MVEFCGAWPIDPECSHGIPANPDERTPAQDSAVVAASEALWALSGRQFGTCRVTVRPCRAGCAQPGEYVRAKQAALAPHETVPMLAMGCGCVGSCGCGPVCEFRLPGPVAGVESIIVDGEPLGPQDFIVYKGGWVVRIGPACWPACQDLSAPLGNPSTWSVTYLHGIPVPVLGQRAVAALAAEILASCDSGRATICRLPSRVTQINREGVAIDLDTTGLLDDGYLGIPEVDVFVSTHNPGKLSRPSRVWTPETPQFRQQTQP